MNDDDEQKARDAAALLYMHVSLIVPLGAVAPPPEGER